MAVDSILTSTKQIVGIEESDTAFDVDITMHVNSMFMVLNQIGIGPDAGFAIEDKAPVWSDFLGDDPMLNPAKTYIYLRTRMLFDPPQNSFLVDAMQKQIQELEWRLNAYREGKLHPIVVIDA